MSLHQLGALVGGRCMGDDVTFQSVSTDSRQIEPGQLFVALPGERFDAHAYVDQARELGAVAALVSREVDSKIPQIIVPDTLQALSAMAAEVRQQAKIPFVAITGSNGKTSVKEMLAGILGSVAPVLATRGNLNNHIGVPLTLLRLAPEHRFAVIEMGASHAGEIAGYCQIAKPNVSLVNNIGAAHLEGFGSLEGVAAAKGEIVASLADDGVAVLNRDDAFFDTLCALAADKSLMSFGFHPEADVQADPESVRMKLDRSGFVCSFVIRYQGQSAQVQLAMPGRHNVSNALAAAAAALAMGLTLEQVVSGLAQVKPVAGRLQVLPGKAGSVLIHDAYNANPRSLQAALSVLAETKADAWLVLGDFAELGPESEAIHADLGRQVFESGVRHLWATGSQMQAAVEAFQAQADRSGSEVSARHFTDKTALIDDFQSCLVEGQVVLVKGSRSQKMEQVIEALIDEEAKACC